MPLTCKSGVTLTPVTDTVPVLGAVIGTDGDTTILSFVPGLTHTVLSYTLPATQAVLRAPSRPVQKHQHPVKFTLLVQLMINKHINEDYHQVFFILSVKMVFFFFFGGYSTTGIINSFYHHSLKHFFSKRFWISKNLNKYIVHKNELLITFCRRPCKVVSNFSMSKCPLWLLLLQKHQTSRSVKKNSLSI